MRLLYILILPPAVFLVYFAITFHSTFPITFFSKDDFPGESKRIKASLRYEIRNESNPVRLAVLKGLNWTVSFTESDINLNLMLTDYLQMLHELTLGKKDKTINSIAADLIRHSISRSKRNLEFIFNDDDEGKWDFIALLPFLFQFEDDIDPFTDFYHSYFTKNLPSQYATSFTEALEAKDYDTMGDYLIDYYFLNYSRHYKKSGLFRLPVDRFFEMISHSLKVPWIYSLHDTGVYRDQNYYITHIVYLLTGYGRYPVKDRIYSTKLTGYLKKHYNDVRYRVNDMDLTAEFLHCLMLLGEKLSPEHRS